jgi:hypothetical protein
MSSIESLPGGAKKRDYWWTVLAIDPLAVPIARFVADRRLLSADQVTWLSAAIGLPIGLAFGWGTRAGLIVGAVLFYVSFLLDCVDGKVARALGTINPDGKALDAVADGLRRASASLGLAVYLWKSAEPNGSDGKFFWAVIYGLLSAYFFSLSGDPAKPQPDTLASQEDVAPVTRAPRGTPAAPDSLGQRSREAQEVPLSADSTDAGPSGSWLARRRLLARPGAPDVAAIALVIGPLFGWVVPCLAIGCALMGIGVLNAILRLLRR